MARYGLNEIFGWIESEGKRLCDAYCLPCIISMIIGITYIHRIIVLHALDEVAHGRLRQLQRIGRQREAARLRNRRQGAELLQRDFIRRRKSGFHDVAS